MVLFGSDNATGEGEAEVILIEIAGALRYTVLLIWVLLCVGALPHQAQGARGPRSVRGARRRRGGSSALVEDVGGGLNEFVKSRAIDGMKARASHFYSRVALAGTWLLSAGHTVVALVAAMVQGKDSNIAYLFYCLSRSVQYAASILYVAYMLLDLEPDRRVAGINTYILAVAACINVPVATVLGESIGDEIAAALAFMCFCKFLGGVRLKASAHPVEEERREHVSIVCSTIVRMLAPLIVMGSEMAWCWLEAYLESGEEEGALMKDDLKCEGIYYGCDGLMLLIVAIGLLPMLTLNAKSALTLENMCKFKLSIIEVVQVGAIGVYSVYAMGYYATRQEREVGDTEQLIKAGMLGMLTVAFVGGSLLKKVEDSVDGEDVARLSSGSVISDRISIGAEKSVWEGGMKGATGKGRIVRASTRGIAKEIERRDESIGEEGEDEATFSPGMM